MKKLLKDKQLMEFENRDIGDDVRKSGSAMATPYELGKDSFEKYGRGYSLPHSEHKHYLREAICAKISR